MTSDQSIVREKRSNEMGCKGKVASLVLRYLGSSRYKDSGDQPRNAQERKGNSHQTLLSNHQMLQTLLLFSHLILHSPLQSTTFFYLIIPLQL